MSGGSPRNSPAAPVSGSPPVAGSPPGMRDGLSDVGIIGMAVMGRNLAMNAASKGFSVSVWNRTHSRTVEAVMAAEKEGVTLRGFANLRDFCDSLRRPRKIVLMVQAGSGVDETLQKLLGELGRGDVVVDGGNEWYRNTEARRTELCEPRGVRYLGMGVSGGERGAREGPSLMPGGDRDAYKLLEPILTKLAADFQGEPCCAFIGRGGAGNYVKMVHNGIEYGDMQLISEVYLALKVLKGCRPPQLSKIFRDWNGGVLRSYLSEITSEIFKKKDEAAGGGAAGGGAAGQASEGEAFLVDVIKPVAGSKGTGKWTSQEAAERGVPCPIITVALEQRYLSTFLQLRAQAAAVYAPTGGAAGSPGGAAGRREALALADFESALYVAKVCAYAQGFMLLHKASAENDFGLDLAKIAAIWRAGCIIRADLLTDISAAFAKDPQLTNLLLEPTFAAAVKMRLPSLRKLALACIAAQIPVPALTAALLYIDTLKCQTPSLNLVQAQRDFFGAHTFERTDRLGTFHAKWE